MDFSYFENGQYSYLTYRLPSAPNITYIACLTTAEYSLIITNKCVDNSFLEVCARSLIWFLIRIRIFFNWKCF